MSVAPQASLGEAQGTRDGVSPVVDPLAVAATPMHFPDCIDTTIRNSFVLCPTQAKRAYFEDLALPDASVDLHFGGAVAHGLEIARVWFHDMKERPAQAIQAGAIAAEQFYGDFEPPAKSAKTKANLRRALQQYFTVWPLDADILQPARDSGGKLMVEWRFKIPIPGLVHPDHGGPIYFVGRSDMIPLLRQGFLCIEDDKTASQLGDQWANKWRMDSQPLGYIWGAQQSGILDPEVEGTAIFRGLSILQPKYRKAGSTTKPTTKTEEELQSGDWEYVPSASFGTSQVVISHAPWRVERWLKQFTADVRRMIHCYLNNEWDYALHRDVCGAYKGCPFLLLCETQNPDDGGWKEVNFVKRVWNPLDTV